MDESVVVIGMDPHKRSATIEVMTGDEQILGRGRFDTDAAGFKAMVRYAKQWPAGPGRWKAARASVGHVARRLVMAGETVVDVPPKLSARARVFATGQGRKTDATDAHSIALVGVRMAGLRPVANNDQLGDPADAGRPAPLARRGPHPDDLPAPPAAARPDPRRGEEGPVRRPGQSAPRRGPAPRRGRQDPPPDRRSSSSPISNGCISGRRPLDKELLALLNSHRHHPDRAATASDRPPRPGSWSRSATSTGSPTGTTSPPGTAPHPSTPPPETTPATGSPGPGTDRSTAPSTSWPSSSSATPATAEPTSTGEKPPGRPRWKPCAASNAGSPTSCIAPCSTTPSLLERAREGNGATTLTPARPAQHPTPALRKSHNPDPPHQAYDQPSPPPLDTEGNDRAYLLSQRP